MRVGIDILFLLPGRVGGTETYAWALIEELIGRRGVEVVLFTNSSTRVPQHVAAKAEVVTLKLSGESRTHRLWTVQTTLPGAAEKLGVDLVHSLGSTCPFRARLPVIVTIHDANWSAIPMPLAKRIGLAVMTRLSAKAAHSVITVSEFSKRELVRWLGIPPDKVRVALSGIGRDTADVRWEDSQSAPYVFALGGDGKNKNIEALIRAFRAVRREFGGCRLVIAGHTNSAVRRMAADDAGIELRGFVERRELLDLYARATAFVMPSLYEGFGIPLAEAMAIGAPCVSSAAGALKEVGEDAVVSFDAGRGEDLAGALRSVLGSTSLRQELSRRGRIRAGAFSWALAADVTLSCYEDAVAGQGSA